MVTILDIGLENEFARFPDGVYDRKMISSYNTDS
ncbi:MAG: hypothetical protein ACJAS1_005029 [Oleiphilaceae bacterium]|jgi:hypothetical protein